MSNMTRPLFYIKLMFLLAPIFTGLLVMRLPLKDAHRAWLFDRADADFECAVPVTSTNPISNSNTNMTMMSHDQMEAFARDGVIYLPNAISKEWLRSYRMLLMHVFHKPSTWDILYSRMVANFYGAQKSIFLHQSSQCGRDVGSNSPASNIAARLFEHLHLDLQSTLTLTPLTLTLNSTNDDTTSTSATSSTTDADRGSGVRMRVIEPTEALVNYGSGEGHTCWHRDDIYMPYKQHEDDEDVEDVDVGDSDSHKQKKTSTVVIRIWVPLMDMSPDQMTFLALNNSKVSKMQRKEKDVQILGTNFRDHAKVSTSEIIEEQIVGPGPDGYRAGDMLVFAGDTPHFAQGSNCSSVGCGRLIFSFALDGATLYDAGKLTSLLPLYSGQEDGKPLRGSQFPLIYPEPAPDHPDWKQPLHPTYGDVALSLYHSMAAGLGSFRGYDVRKAMPYFSRVYDAFRDDVWVKPHVDLETGERVSSV